MRPIISKRSLSDSNIEKVATNTKQVGGLKTVEELPAFIYRSKDWIGLYQSWAKKRNQKPLTKEALIADNAMLVFKVDKGMPPHDVRKRNNGRTLWRMTSMFF